MKPTIRELLRELNGLESWLGQADLPHGSSDAELIGTLTERVEAVLKLHNYGGKECYQCCGAYHDPETHPCPTVLALNGEQP